MTSYSIQHDIKDTSQIELLKLNSYGTMTWYTKLVPGPFLDNFAYLHLLMGPYYTEIDLDRPKEIRPFMPEYIWPFVYRKGLKIQAGEDSTDGNTMSSTTALFFETLCGRIIHHLMILYLNTVFMQLKNEDNNASGGKRAMWELVQTQIESFK